MRTTIALFCFIYFMMPVAGTGQIVAEINRINADSLKEILPQLEGRQEIDALNKLALSLSIEKPDSSIFIAGQTILMSEDNAYLKGAADGYFILGNVYYLQDSLKPTVINYLNALRLYEQLPPCEWMGITLGNLAYVNWLVGRTEKTIEYYRRQFRLYQQLDLPLPYQWGSVITIAYFLDGIEKYDSIYPYIDKAYELAEKYHDSSYLTYTSTNLFRFMLHHYQADPTDKTKLEQCISLGLKTQDLKEFLDMDRTGCTIWQMFMYIHLAMAYLEDGTDESLGTGLEYLSMVESIYDTIDFNYSDIIQVYNLYAAQRSRSGDYKGAIKYYEKGIAEYNKNISRSNIKYAYDNILWDFLDRKVIHAVYDSLYRNYSRTGNYKKALEYHTLRDKIENEIFLESKLNMMAMLEADSENEKAKKQIAFLENERQIKELKFSQARNINIGIGVLFVVFFLLAILFVRQIKLKNEYKNNILKQKLLRLQMNPHFIFNALSNIHNLVLRDDKHKASEYLVSFSRLLRTSLETSREDFLQLEDEISMIRNYLEIQCLKNENNFDYYVEVDQHIDMENAIIPPMIIQPFIENAIEHGIKHSQSAGRVDVRFRHQDNRLICEVEDNGIGRKKAGELAVSGDKKHKSLAVEIIMDRIKIFNRKFRRKIKIEIIDKYSEAGQSLGTEVKINLPYLLG